jgi:hypothetical protein
MALVLGVDVSSFQDPSASKDRNLINWASVERTPYDFALARMSIGMSTLDEDGRQNLAAMLKLKVPVCGAYGVVGYTEPVEEGAALLVAEIAAVTDPRGVLVMLDAEDYSKRPDGTVPHPTIDQVDRYAIALHQLLGRWPVAYVPKWWLAKHGYSVKGRALANCPWAPSRYISGPWSEARLLAAKPTDLAGFKRLAWLQFTSSGTVSGITGKVDLNVYYGDLALLRRELLGLGAATPAEPQQKGALMALTDAEQGEVLKAARHINGTVAPGQTSFEGTVKAILGTTQSLVNLVKGSQGTLAAGIVDLRSALLGAIAAMPTPTGGDLDEDAVADRIAASLRAAGVTVDPAAIAAALRQQLAAALAE